MRTCEQQTTLTGHAIWSDLVTECGRTDASRGWLAIFAATDAPRTG
jgi:hypothetical protein